MRAGKKKKQLLQAKRRAQRERQGEDVEVERHHQSEAQLAGEPRHKLRTVLQREDAASVQRGRADATRPLELLESRQDVLPPWPAQLQPPVSMPLRPAWSYDDTTATLDARETSAFASWESDLHARFPGHQLARYERNLEVWRQLWRTLEVSDALLVIVDARTPLLSFPAPLYVEAVSRGLPVVCLLNKADLLPPEVADAWTQSLREKFPKLHAVVCFRADPGAAPKGFKGAGKRRVGFNRWRGGGPGIRADVDRLLHVIQSLPVARDEARTFGDFWDAQPAQETTISMVTVGGTQDLSTRQDVEDDVSDDDMHDDKHQEDAHAAAALAQSDQWAASHPEVELVHAMDAEARRTRPYVTLGVVGEPNMGKSAVINRLFGAPVVKASPTPGCTKHLQTLFLRRRVRLADCPGLVFPKVGVPIGMQLLCGNAPIAQAREPFSTVRYLSEMGVHPPLHVAYGLSLADVSDQSCTVPGEWSPYAICEALALKRSFLTRGGGPDVSRAANRILRDALAGKNIRLAFVPPGMPPVAWPATTALASELGQPEQSSASEDDGDHSEKASDDDAPGLMTERTNAFAALGSADADEDMDE